MALVCRAYLVRDDLFTKRPFVCLGLKSECGPAFWNQSPTGGVVGVVAVLTIVRDFEPLHDIL